jgi:hypothetical protein
VSISDKARPLNEVSSSVHNSEVNTVAAEADLCGMTHLATGRLCLLPKRHPGGCDFRTEGDVEAATELR